MQRRRAHPKLGGDLSERLAVGLEARAPSRRQPELGVSRFLPPDAEHSQPPSFSR
jgi:hypothetical protein